MILLILNIKKVIFKPHEDYLSLTTNMVEEYSGIMCVDANCEGGETIFHLNKKLKHISKSSITEKNTVLFRKDIRHEGNLIKNGFKEIITFNLWATPKNNDSVVIISFKDDKENGHYYLIPYGHVMSFDNVIKNYIHFNSLEGKNIIHYLSEYVNYDEFKIIYQIFMKSYTLEETLNNCDKIIDYFGISYENILVDFSKEKNGFQKTKHSNIVSFGEDIIISDTPEKTKYLTEIVKKMKLPYIPFKVVLAEGIYGYGGEMTGEPPSIFKMEPVYATFSEYNNILTSSSLCTKGTISHEDYTPSYLYKYQGTKITDIDMESIMEPIDMNILSYRDKTIIENKLNLEMCTYGPSSYGLEICKPNLTIYDITSELTSGSHTRDTSGLLYIANGPNDNDNVKWYGIDDNNKMFLGRKHYIHARKHLEEMKFFNKLRNKLKTTKLIYPQRKYSFQEHFCNEAVYGNLNLIILTGLVKLDKIDNSNDINTAVKEFYNFTKRDASHVINVINEWNEGYASDIDINIDKFNSDNTDSDSEYYYKLTDL